MFWTKKDKIVSKITLSKTGDNFFLEKQTSSSEYGRVVCNLNWDSGKTGSVDLDLGCLYELRDGTKSVVQALGNCFGSYEDFPYIHLEGDDRSGSNAEGEFLYVNGDCFNEFKRICIYAFIYQGVANWSQANAYVTVKAPNNPVVEIRLDQHKNGLNMCAIAMLENTSGQLKLTKLAKYFAGHVELDKKYKWGMQWTAGSK
jgi:tellurite resistance protein TerA